MNYRISTVVERIQPNWGSLRSDRIDVDERRGVESVIRQNLNRLISPNRVISRIIFPQKWGYVMSSARARNFALLIRIRHFRRLHRTYLIRPIK